MLSINTLFFHDLRDLSALALASNQGRVCHMDNTNHGTPSKYQCFFMIHMTTMLLPGTQYQLTGTDQGFCTIFPLGPGTSVQTRGGLGTRDWPGTTFWPETSVQGRVKAAIGVVHMTNLAPVRVTRRGWGDCKKHVKGSVYALASITRIIKQNEVLMFQWSRESKLRHFVNREA